MFWFYTYIIIISIESKGRKKIKIKKNPISLILWETVVLSSPRNNILVCNVYKICHQIKVNWLVNLVPTVRRQLS